MDDQVTFRIPRELFRTLQRLAATRDVPKSQLVREALQLYLSGVEASPVAKRGEPGAGGRLSRLETGGLVRRSTRSLPAEIQKAPSVRGHPGVVDALLADRRGGR